MLVYNKFQKMRRRLEFLECSRVAPNSEMEVITRDLPRSGMEIDGEDARNARNDGDLKSTSENNDHSEA